MAFEYKKTIPLEWEARLRWNELPDEVQEEIGKYGLHMYSQGRHVVSAISDVKYEGRLIILEDGTRWEVDSIDAPTCEFWSASSRVVVIDREMYCLDDCEKVAVREE